MSLTREVLQGMVSGLANPEESYLAEAILPAIEGPRVGVIGTRNVQAKLGTLGDLDVAPNAAPKRLDRSAESSINYSTSIYGLSELLSYDLEDLNQVVIREAESILGELRLQVLHDREARLEALIRTGTWNTASGAVAAADQWDTSTGDPIAQIMEDDDAIVGGANVVIMGRTAWRSFRNNANVIARLRDNAHRTVTTEVALDLLADSLGHEVKLYVPRAMDAALAPLWDDDYFVARIDGQGGMGVNGLVLKRPTALARIQPTPLSVKTWEDPEAGGKGGQMIKVFHEDALVQVTPELGVLHTAVNG